MPKPFLTIGMATYDDFYGLFPTIQAIRMYNKSIMSETEFIVIDNNPDSNHGRDTKAFITNDVRKNGRYIPYTEKKSTSVRNRVFEEARGDFVVCIDPHIMVVENGWVNLINFAKNHLGSKDLYQGPLLYDDLDEDASISTHFDLTWRAAMYGTWQRDPRGVDPNADPFEIQSQGLGLFGCFKDAWLGFNPLFRGFGGEEGYIHAKYVKAGRKCWCLPFLKWNHRFKDPAGKPYKVTIEDRVYNYCVGWRELGRDQGDIMQHFSQTHPQLKDKLIKIRDQANADWDGRAQRYSMEELKGMADQLTQHMMTMPVDQRNAALLALRGSNEVLYYIVAGVMTALRNSSGRGAA